MAGGGAGGCTWRVLMGLPRREAALKVALGSPLNAVMRAKGKIIGRGARLGLGVAAPGLQHSALQACKQRAIRKFRTKSRP